MPHTPLAVRLALCIAVWCAAATRGSTVDGFVVPSEVRRRVSSRAAPGAGIASALRVRGDATGHPTTMSLFHAAARAGAQSACIMTVADIATQLAFEGRRFGGAGGSGSVDRAGAIVSAPTRYDPARTLRWAAVGIALHGPYFFLSFSRLDRLFGPASTLAVVAKKTVFAQFVVFPPYLVAMFSFMGVMENSDDVLAKVRDRVPKAFASGCIFWPLANSINFSVVPSSGRVLYIAGVGALWNGYLSYMNARKDEGGGGTKKD